jgi:hypothetical protein
MDVKKTITTIFMVPTLKIDRVQLKKNNYINAYLSDVRRDVQYKDAVYLLFKPGNLNTFREFLDKEYERTKDILDDYDYEDGYVVVVYKLNSKWKKDFLLVKEGAYSRTSEEFKKQFPKTIEITRNFVQRDEISLQHRIFMKTIDLKEYWEDKLDINFTDDMEVWDGFNIENEVLDLDKLKKEETV